MAFVNDSALDALLNDINDATILHICSDLPTNYTEATSTFSLGSKSGLGLPAPVNGDTSGRKIVIPAITDGSVTATGTASHYALVDGSTLKAAHTLISTVAVTSGQTFQIGSFDIEISDPSGAA